MTVTLRSDELTATLEVHNRGLVIDANTLLRIFDPFTRGAAQSGDGIGLGLFIVHHIVEAHGGRVTVHSSESEGTTFSVSLPRQGPAASAGG